MSGLRHNGDSLVEVRVTGRVADARWHVEEMRMDRDGHLSFLPGTGGIALGVHVGDPAGRWEADHLMVGASVEDAVGRPFDPGAFHLLACIGNPVFDGAGGRIGVVAGKRGGLAPGFYPPNLVSVEVPDARLTSLVPGDRVVVSAFGRGLALLDHWEVVPSNASPWLLDHLPVEEWGGRLQVAVRLVVAPRFAGAGLGQDAWIGDLEITDPDAAEPNGNPLRFGDLVAFEAVDSRTNRFYRPGLVSIGVVSHGPSPAPGHGVGVTILLSGPEERLVPTVEETASIASAIRGWSEEGG